MRKLRFFAALCCAAAVFTACGNNDPKNDTKEAVDLGLSVKWATCNVGATSPEGYGNYYAWGETTTKSDYDWDTYKYGSAYNALTKYCNNSNYGKDGFTDGRTTLEASDDAATANWGGKWRMPTDAEWTELREKCTWTWTTLNGVKGYEVKGPNGNTIFLSAAGHRDDGLYGAGYAGDYWSSSLLTDDPRHAGNAAFNSSGVDWGYNDRYFGFSVRPVLK